MVANLKLHAHTKCRVIDLADIKFKFQPTGFQATLLDGTVIQTNFCDLWHAFQKSNAFRFFLIDDTDVGNMENVWKECKNEREKLQKTEEYLATVTKFSEKFPNKRIYVRLIPPVTVGSEEEKRVFAAEVMEILPIVMRQQGNPIRWDDHRLVNLRFKCANIPIAGGYLTFPITKFEEILDAFDIDKSLITLIPDPSYEMMRREFIQHGGHIRFFAPDEKIVSDVYQAINHIFQVVVMGVNWKNDECILHRGCMFKMKQMIMKYFENLAANPRLWLNCEKQFEFIKKVRTQCESTHRFRSHIPDYFFHFSFAEDAINIDYYNMVVSHFDLPKYPVFLPAVKDKCLPVWMHRMLCKLGWIQQFFVEGDSEKVKDILIECLYFMVPEKYVNGVRVYVNKVLDGSIAEEHYERFTFVDSETQLTAKKHLWNCSFYKLKQAEEVVHGMPDDVGLF